MKINQCYVLEVIQLKTKRVVMQKVGIPSSPCFPILFSCARPPTKSFYLFTIARRISNTPYNEALHPRSLV